MSFISPFNLIICDKSLYIILSDDFIISLLSAFSETQSLKFVFGPGILQMCRSAEINVFLIHTTITCEAPQAVQPHAGNL